MSSPILAHDVEDAAEGVTLVLIHPLGADGRFWEDCRRGFGTGVRTVSCDLRGTGRSPAATGPVGLEDSVEDIENLRSHLGPERIVVVGCAVGAMVAALYAASYPNRTDGLVMSNPGIRITEAAGADLAARAEKVRREGMRALLPQALDNAFAGYTDAMGRQRYEERFLSQDPQGYAWAALGLEGADLSGSLGAIRCPTLLVAGGMDRLFPPPIHAKEVHEKVAGSELVEFDDAAHFIPYQQPSRFADAVAAFLDRKGLRG